VREPSHEVLFAKPQIPAVSGKIIAAGQTPLDIINKLAPGEALHYTVVILLGAGFDPQTAQYTVAAWGQQP
jgi:hypothetical protein